MGERVAFIVGASRGFGADIARAFAKQGIENIILNARNEKDLHEVAASITAHTNTRVDIIPFDIANKNDEALAEDLTKLFIHIRDEYGKLDIAVYNAGIFRFAPAIPQSALHEDKETLRKRVHTIITDIDQTMSPSLLGMQKLVQVLQPLQLEAPEPKALLLSSEAALRYRFNNTAYGPAKTGLARLAFDIYTNSEGKITPYRLFPSNFLTPGNSAREGILYLRSEELADKAATMVLSGRHTELYAVQLIDGAHYTYGTIPYDKLRKELHDKHKRFGVSAKLHEHFVEWQNSEELRNLLTRSSWLDKD